VSRARINIDLFPPTPDSHWTALDVDAQGVEIIRAYDRYYLLRGENYPLLRISDEGWAEAELADAPRARGGVFAYNRLWLIEGKETIRPSDLLDDNWDSLAGFDVDSGDGQKLVALHAFREGQMLAFKDSSVWLLAGCNDPSGLGALTKSPLDTLHGLAAPRSVVDIGRDTWYLSQGGVRSISLTEQNQVQTADVTVSAKIPARIARINWRAAAGACAAVHDNYFLLSVPVDGSETNNTVLVFDLLMKCWVGEWTIEVARWLSSTVRQRLYAMDYEGTIREVLADHYDDDAEIEFEVVTRGYSFGAADVPKKFAGGEILVEHRDPLMDVELRSDDIQHREGVVTDQDWDTFAYEVHGLDTWDGSGATHDDPHRENYAPLRLSDLPEIDDVGGGSGSGWPPEDWVWRYVAKSYTRTWIYAPLDYARREACEYETYGWANRTACEYETYGWANRTACEYEPVEYPSP